MFLYLFSVFDNCILHIISSVQTHIRIARNKIIIKTFGVSDSICPIEHSHNFIVCDINQIVIEGINDTKPCNSVKLSQFNPRVSLDYIYFTSVISRLKFSPTTLTKDRRVCTTVGICFYEIGL